MTHTPAHAHAHAHTHTHTCTRTHMHTHIITRLSAAEVLKQARPVGQGQGPAHPASVQLCWAPGAWAKSMLLLAADAA